MQTPAPTPPAEVTAPSVARRRLRRWLGALLLAVLALPLIGFVIDGALHDGRVPRGVQIAGLDVGGFDRTALQAALPSLAVRLAERHVTLRVGRAELDVDPLRVGFRLDEPATADAALAVGRARSLPTRFAAWLRRFASAEDVAPVAHVDGPALAREIDDWEPRAVLDLPSDGAVRADASGALVAELPHAGHKLDRARSTELVERALARRERPPVELPLSDVTPRLGRAAVDAALERARRLASGAVSLIEPESGVVLELSAVELARAVRSRVTTDEPPSIELEFDPASLDPRLVTARAAIEHGAEDARFVVGADDRVSVVASRRAASLDAASVARAALEAASSVARSGELTVTRGEAPAFMTAAAEGLHITRLVSSFSTHHPCCQPRVENIHHIADLLRGKVVLPGETFSVNATVGPRTRKNGFVPAPTIEEGEMMDSLGGGISQFATTFFNAVFHGGYDIVERQPHTYWFPRYPMGHEATLSYPKPDLAFRNDSDAGVLIWTRYTDTSITVMIFGDNGGRKVVAKVSPRIDVVRPTLEYIPNPEGDPEKDKVKEGGMIGWSVIVSREITFADGKKKLEKRKVTYKPRPRRMEVHPCKIPRGEPDYTGEKCPEPEE